MLQVSITYLAMLVFFVCAELIVLTNIIQPLFSKHIGHLMKENTNFLFAAVFYLFYVAGVYWFATKAGLRSDSLAVAILSGGFLGLIAFGTFELTNHLILKDWKIVLAFIDTAWGIYELVCENMAGSIRIHIVEKNSDPILKESKKNEELPTKTASV